MAHTKKELKVESKWRPYWDNIPTEIADAFLSVLERLISELLIMERKL